MSEAEWLTHDFSVLPLLRRPPGLNPSDRKHRLFSVACCRRTAEWVEHPDLPPLIDAAERLAERPYEVNTAVRPEQVARSVVESVRSADAETGLYGLALAVRTLFEVEPDEYSVARLCVEALSGWDEYEAGYGEALYQADLYREVFGNPFRPIAFDPVWRTPTVEAIAAGVYADRAFDRLPVLADALEDAGCDAAELLAHLRSPSPHVRGCWALDLVLGKS